MREVYIVDAARTAIGKIGGAFKAVTADFLGAHVIEGLLNKIDDAIDVDEVILGQARQSADAANIARVAALRAHLPTRVTAYTVHRQCGSGLQAIHNGAQQIALGLQDVIIAGGTESLSTAPFYLRHARYGFGVGNGVLYDSNTESQINSQPVEQYGAITMGFTAENLAEKYEISREEQDRFSLRSQQLALSAIEAGYFEPEIIPFAIHGKLPLIIKDDEHPRQTSLEQLTKLKPVFKDDGSVTAGSSSGRNDGAAALLLMSKERIEHYGLQPKAKIIAQAVAGVAPEFMGIGPVHATDKALKQANLTLDDIDLIELNEAFAAQALAVIQEAKMDINKVNVNGGAIALGHPIGATGAILMTKLVYELQRRNAKYGLVTLCIGGGQGITTIIENCNYSSNF